MKRKKEHGKRKNKKWKKGKGLVNKSRKRNKNDKENICEKQLRGRKGKLGTET